MKKSELLAKYIHFNEDIIVIDKKEFFMQMGDLGGLKPKYYTPLHDCEVMEVTRNGFTFHCYSSLQSDGITCDTFYFKLLIVEEGVYPSEELIDAIPNAR